MKAKSILGLTLVLGLIVGLVAASPLAANGDTATICGYDVTYNGVTNNPDGTSTWSYTVKPGAVTPAKGLSHWVLGLCVPEHDNKVQEPTDPDPWTQGTDSSHTGITGIKWDYEVLEDSTGVTFTVTLSEYYDVGISSIGGKYGSKKHPETYCVVTVADGVTITGPDCDYTPTAVTLSSFAAKSSAGGWASPLWLGLAGLTVVVAGSLFWAKRRAS